MVFNKKLFIVLNAQDAFWLNEMETVFQKLNRHDISVTFCSAHCSKDFSESERVILVDKDLAELHLRE